MNYIEGMPMLKIQFLPRRDRFKSLIAELKNYGVQCNLISGIKYRNFFALPTLKFINSIDADVFVSSNPYYGLFAAGLAKKKGTLDYSVFRLKGDYWTELKHENGTVKKRLGCYIKKIENFIALKDVDFTITISNWMKKKAEEKGLNNLYVLYNGVDYNRFRPRNEDPAYKSQLLCVMNFNIYQKMYPLYDFLSEYKRRNMPYHITFLGTGLYLQSLKNHVTRLGLNKKVTFKGWINKVEYYYSNCDILIHPSGLEALGMAPIEAGASSKPTISTNVGGIPEIIVEGKTGFLSNDIDYLLDHVTHLMENKDIRDKMGLTARKRIMENYSWSNSAKIFIDILKKEGII